MEKKNNKILWIVLMVLGIIPYIHALILAIHSFFYGSGLVGDKGGISSAMMIIPYIIYFWYIYILALLLIIISINRILKSKNNK